MAIANLQETLLMYTMRRNALNLELTELQSRKKLAVMDRADVQSLLSSEKHSIRDYFKNLYRNDEELQALYTGQQGGRDKTRSSPLSESL